MKSNFITLRFDRLKYLELCSLYREINNILLREDMEIKHLTVPITRFGEQMTLLTNLGTKVRNKFFNKDHAVHLKRLDDLISALLLHLKALKRADFSEFSYDVHEVDKIIRKELSNFVHVGAANKKTALNRILVYFDPSKDTLWEKAVSIGVSRYIEELRLTREKMNSIENDEKVLKKGQASSVEAIKAKSETIQELRLLFQHIDMASLSYPEVDYSMLIARINYELKTYRAQLRNLQTRRIRKKEKELNKE